MDKTLCETPTVGKKPTRIDTWKYDLVAAAILDILPPSSPGIPFKELPALVGEKLGAESTKVGSMAWYTTTVKLDLEVKGKIKQVEGLKPQHLMKV